MSHEKKIAIEAVLQATDLACKMQGRLEALDVLSKEDLSFVTITDLSCQALINMHLLRHCPDIAIVGEEDSFFLRQSENKLVKAKVIELIRRFYPKISENAILDAIDQGGAHGGPHGRWWALDPIDGTKGFIRDEQYAVALGLIEEGELALGVLSCPRLEVREGEVGVLLVAEKGKGASYSLLGRESYQPLRVTRTNNCDELIYCETHLPTTSHSHEKALLIAKQIHAKPAPFRLDSQCKYAAVALNQAAIYLRIPTYESYQEKVWDHAAGVIILEEAGGKVTDLKGKRLDFTQGKTLLKNRGIVATNGYLHDQVIAAAKKFASM